MGKNAMVGGGGKGRNGGKETFGRRLEAEWMRGVDGKGEEGEREVENYTVFSYGVWNGQ